MNNTTAVFTPKVVKDLPPPVYRPPTLAVEPVSTPQVVVDNMYLTKDETDEETANWYLNVVDSHGRVFVYRLDVNWA